METRHLLKSPANAARLFRALEDADKGLLIEHALEAPGNAPVIRHPEVAAKRPSKDDGR